MKTRMAFGGALAIAAIVACSDRGSSAALLVSSTDVTGTYFAADSGHSLGKDWCYSGALVLDSTHHYGSVIKMCSDDGSGPVTERLSGKYHLTTVTTRENGGPRVRKVRVVLEREGSHNSHTLVYDAGTLRFDEPWWMGAGLRALDIPDPVLKRISPDVTTDSTGLPAVASSTPVSASKTSAAKAPVKDAQAKAPARK